MLVRLITPANEDSAFVRSLAVCVLAAHTPRFARVEHTDDLLHPIPLDRLPPADLVGISVFSKTARRAYAIADAYRAARIPVVLGGIHVTACPTEGASHADAVVVGEAEGLWHQVVLDAMSGRLQRLYRRDRFPSLEHQPIPLRDTALFPSRRYIPMDVVQTMRGCPFQCEFCSVNVQAGSELRLRPARDVAEELERLGRFVMFADDNIIVTPGRARELLGEIAPLRKRWIGQASLAGLDRPESVELLRRSGCVGLFIGFETLSETSLRAQRKFQNHPSRYLDAVARLHDAGIAIWGSFVFGFDDDDPSVFDRTVAFAREARLALAMFTLLTPYPETLLYARLQREARLSSPAWWLETDHDRLFPAFEPRGMTREQLREGWMKAWHDFYGAKSILSRWRPRLRNGLLETLAFLPLNAFMHRLTEEKIVAGHRFFVGR